MNILEFLRNGNKIKKALLGTNLDVDTRSDTTRKGYHEGHVAYGAADAFNTAGLWDLLNYNISGNPYIITGTPSILPGRVGSIRGFELSKNASKGELIWKYLFDYVHKHPQVVRPTTPSVPLGYVKGSEIGYGKVKLPLEGLTIRKNTPLSLENRAMNPAEKAAAEDYLATRNPKDYEKFPDVIVNTKLPTGRPTGDYKYPREILEKYGLGPKKVTTQSVKIPQTSAKLKSHERYVDRRNYTRNLRMTDKNNQTYETGDSRHSNSGLVGIKNRQIRNVLENISKYPQYELRALEKLKVKLAKKGLSREEIERSPEVKDFCRRLADLHGQFKQGGILEFLRNGSGIYIKKKNRGKFTKSAKAAGLTVQEHAKSVLNDPNATPLQKKRANFARNVAKWHHKHLYGGNITDDIHYSSMINPHKLFGMYSLYFVNLKKQQLAIKAQQEAEKILKQTDIFNKVLDIGSNLLTTWIQNKPQKTYNAPTQLSNFLTNQLNNFWTNPSVVLNNSSISVSSWWNNPNTLFAGLPNLFASK